MELLLGATILITTTIVSTVCSTTKTVENDDQSEKIRLELLREKLINKMK